MRSKEEKVKIYIAIDAMLPENVKMPTILIARIEAFENILVEKGIATSEELENGMLDVLEKRLDSSTKH